MRKYMAEFELNVSTWYKTLIPVESLQKVNDGHNYHIYFILTCSKIFIKPESIYYFFISKSQKTRDSIEDEIDTMIEKVDEDDIEKKIGKYISVMKEKICNNRNKYFAYQYVLEKEIDLNFSGFWMSTIAVIISVMTVAFTYVSDNNIESDIELKTKRFILTFKEIVKEDVINYKLFCIICFVIICIIFVSVYYGKVNKARKKYKPVLIALSEIKIKCENGENEQMIETKQESNENRHSY